jgi:hypothetical protein
LVHTNSAVQVVSGNGLIVLSNTVTLRGDRFGFHDAMLDGHSIGSGLVWNRSDQPAELAYCVGDGTTVGSLVLEPGEMLAVGSFLDLTAVEGAPPSGGPQTCSVACASGWFACCRFEPGLYPTCRCIKNGTSIEDGHCNSGGGAGSVSCTATQSPPAPGQVPKPQ